MSHNLQNFAKFQKFQLDNLVDFEKCCRTHIFLQKSVPIQPKTSNIFQNFAKNWQLPYGSAARSARPSAASPRTPRGPSPSSLSPGAHSRCLRSVETLLYRARSFTGLVLGCIEAKFCKKICVRQHFSSSTRFAYFCTAAISKFSQKIGLKNQQFL